ncbi:MAG: LLM class flavin-dependent oxidoreductase [Caldilineaceae bacterium]|nr:LLM class flavin-dependent oxidoreductase [Caldilineaceae bacterium]MCB0143586.1 LLM class flavin-dependent oxidoreductase [Caldilineaceae bacterium]
MQQPFRLGFLTHLEGAGSPQQIYQDGLELITTADQLGFDVFWIAQHHFTGHVGRMPSPFPFLAAAAERTKQIRLGTSIVVLPLETPLRVAEDAAVLDTLSGGRLELGVGSGGDPAEFDAFGVQREQRHPLTTSGLEILQKAFRGEALGAHGQEFYPPAPTLINRLWQAALSSVGAEFVAKNEAGLLLAKAAWGPDEATDKLQLPVAQTYLDTWSSATIEPRIGLSRGIYLAEDKKSALAQVGDGVRKDVAGRINQGLIADDLSLEHYAQYTHLAYGHPEEVAATLAADAVLPHTTDLILQFTPIFPPLDQALHMMEQIATVIGPALGWQPHQNK